MFDHTSRYFNLDVGTFDYPDGRTVTYVRRRFLPQGSEMTLIGAVGVQPGDRLDLIAHRVLGDPLAAWRILDANDAMDPAETLREAAADPTRRLRIPMPQA